MQRFGLIKDLELFSEHIGFRIIVLIGTNMAIKLVENKNGKITVVGRNLADYIYKNSIYPDVVIQVSSLEKKANLSSLEEPDAVYHFVSTLIFQHSQIFLMFV